MDIIDEAVTIETNAAKAIEGEIENIQAKIFDKDRHRARIVEIKHATDRQNTCKAELQGLQNRVNQAKADLIEAQKELDARGPDLAQEIEDTQKIIDASAIQS